MGGMVEPSCGIFIPLSRSGCATSSGEIIPLHRTSVTRLKPRDALEFPDSGFTAVSVRSVGAMSVAAVPIKKTCRTGEEASRSVVVGKALGLVAHRALALPDPVLVARIPFVEKLTRCANQELRDVSPKPIRRRNQTER